MPKPKTESNGRKQLLQKTIQDINKRAGAELIKFGKDQLPKERIPFGIKEIDDFTGGGIQRGNFTVIYGTAGIGKSTLAMVLTAQAQKMGLECVYIDLEHGFDLKRSKQFNVKEGLLLVEEIDTAEQSMDIIIKLAKEKVVDLIIVDSIQAMSPKQELLNKQGDMKSLEDETMALLARKLGQFFRMCASQVYKGNVAVLMIGQVRTQGIGSFITRLGLSGGHALKHWSIQTIYMRRGQAVDAPTRTQTIDGKRVKVKLGFDCVFDMEKTKVSSVPEGTKLHLPFFFDKGFQ